MPLLHRDGSAAAAVAVQGPTHRMADDRIPDLVAALRTAAERMSPLLSAPH